MTTRILVSFAMANGGHMFVQWLRDRLMKHYGLFSGEAVYVDFVQARSGSNYHFAPDAVPKWYDKPNPFKGRVQLDQRDKVASATGSHPIGASHPFWRSKFDRAMQQSEVVLFVLTKEFTDSEWCRQELEGFGKMLKRKPSLRGVVLDLDGIGFDPAARGMPVERMTVLQGKREPGLGGGLLWDAGLWAITQSTWDALVAAVGRHADWREAA